MTEPAPKPQEAKPSAEAKKDEPAKPAASDEAKAAAAPAAAGTGAAAAAAATATATPAGETPPAPPARNVSVATFQSALAVMKDRLAEAVSAAKMADGGKVDAGTVEKLRRTLAVEAARVRGVRRDALLTLDRARQRAETRGVEVARREAEARMVCDVRRATEVCLALRQQHMAKCKELGDAFEVPVEEFFEKNERVEGESEVALLKRRLEFEIAVITKLTKENAGLKKTEISYKTELRTLKKFFSDSRGPLDDFISHVKGAYQSVGGSPDGIGSITPSFLPVALYRIQRSLVDGLGDGSVCVEGSVEEAKKFAASAKGPSSVELYPLRVTARLHASGDPPTLRFYFKPRGQTVIAEAVGFDHSILVNSSGASGVNGEDGVPLGPTTPHKGLFYAGRNVQGVSGSWVEAASRAPFNPITNTYDSSAVVHQIQLLLKDIEYKECLKAIWATLSMSSSCLNLTNIVPLVQKYLPSYPSPKLAVTYVHVDDLSAAKPAEKKDDTAPSPRAAKASRQSNDPDSGASPGASRSNGGGGGGGDAAAEQSVTLVIDTPQVRYTIVGTVSAGYPNRPPTFKIKVGHKEEEVFKIPDVLQALAAPGSSDGAATSGTSTAVRYRIASTDGPALRGGRSGGTAAGAGAGAEKRKAAAASVLDGSFTNEVAEHFSKVVNRDAVLDTPLTSKGHVLMRQILMSIYFVEGFHPYLLRKGVAGLYTETERPIAEACLAQHHPSLFRLLRHTSAPLHRGKQVQLPLHWDTQYLRWDYKAPSEVRRRDPAQTGQTHTPTHPHRHRLKSRQSMPSNQPALEGGKREVSWFAAWQE